MLKRICAALIFAASSVFAQTKFYDGVEQGTSGGDSETVTLLVSQTNDYAKVHADPTTQFDGTSSGVSNTVFTTFGDGTYGWSAKTAGGGGGDFMADGSVPMTGDFNGGGNNITNITTGFLTSIGLGGGAPTNTLHVYGPATITGNVYCASQFRAAGNSYFSGLVQSAKYLAYGMWNDSLQLLYTYNVTNGTKLAYGVYADTAGNGYTTLCDSNGSARVVLYSRYANPSYFYTPGQLHKLGINTNVPGAELHVVGNEIVSGSITLGGTNPLVYADTKLPLSGGTLTGDVYGTRFYVTNVTPNMENELATKKYVDDLTASGSLLLWLYGSVTSDVPPYAIASNVVFAADVAITNTYTSVTNGMYLSAYIAASNQFSKLPAGTTLTVHYHATRTGNANTDVSIRGELYRRTVGGVETNEVDTGDTFTIQEAATEYEIQHIIVLDSDINFDPTDRLLIKLKVIAQSGNPNVSIITQGYTGSRISVPTDEAGISLRFANLESATNALQTQVSANASAISGLQGQTNDYAKRAESNTFSASNTFAATVQFSPGAALGLGVAPTNTLHVSGPATVTGEVYIGGGALVSGDLKGSTVSATGGVVNVYSASDTPFNVFTDASGSHSLLSLLNDAGTPTLDITDSSDNLHIQLSADYTQDSFIYTAGQEHHFGVNTATPAVALDVVGDISASGSISAGGTNIITTLASFITSTNALQTQTTANATSITNLQIYTYALNSRITSNEVAIVALKSNYASLTNTYVIPAAGGSVTIYATNGPRQALFATGAVTVVMAPGLANMQQEIWLSLRASNTVSFTGLGTFITTNSSFRGFNFTDTSRYSSLALLSGYGTTNWYINQINP